MLYSELRRRLAENAVDSTRSSARANDVYFALYDKGRPWVEGWEIRVVDGQYEVGFFERGQFTLEKTFGSESECCDWLFQYLTRPRQYVEVSEDERRAARERMHARIAAERQARRAKEADGES